jgi:4-diphosphocytidyl-2-C-methyl-D-erythritol kinase
MALGIGRGDEVYPLADGFTSSIALILPDFAVETARAYSRLRLTKRQEGPRLPYFVSSAADGTNGLFYLGNDLESATMELFPAIADYKASLIELGAAPALMSGSGSAVFGVLPDMGSAQAAAADLVARGIRALATRTLSRREYRERRWEEVSSP